MTTTPTPHLSSLDDIIFEGRNKAYGAYVLRRAYSSHLRTAVLLATALAALLLAIPLAVQMVWPADPVSVPDPESGITTLGKVVLPTNPDPVKPTKAVVAVIRPRREVAPEVVDDAHATPPQEQPEEQASATAGTTSEAGNAAGSGSTSGVEGGTDSMAPPVAPPAPPKPFVHAEEMPEFMGGTAALTKYLQRHLRYPTPALREGVSGKVYISFTVNIDGTITDVEVLKGLGYGTDEEASRVIRGMPAWKPGRQNQHAVPVRYTLPITFHYE